MPRKQIMQSRGIVRVTFDLPPAVKGNMVYLVGDFTSWEGIPMAKQDDGSWRTTVDLQPGRSYEFRYLIDGTRWENDWEADRYMRNPYGHENSVVDVPELPTAGAKTAPAKKAAAKTSSAKKSAAQKTTAKTTTARKTATKKTAAKKSTAKKSTTKKAAPKKSKPDTKGEG